MNERIEAVFARALAEIPPALFTLVEQRHDGSTRGPSPQKYLIVNRWLRVCAERAVSLDLDTCPPLRVLDIGTGAGYFPLVCRALGHEVIATDWSGRDALYRDVAAATGLDVVDLDVSPCTPLGIVEAVGRVDLISAYMITFNGHRVAPWGVEEWSYFVDDCRAALRPGGRLVLELNREPDGRCYPDELGAWFRSIGAVGGPAGNRVVIS